MFIFNLSTVTFQKKSKSIFFINNFFCKHLSTLKNSLNKKFRIQGKKFLLTFNHQRKYSLSYVLKNILERERLIRFVLVTQGSHNSIGSSFYSNSYYKIILVYTKEKNIQSFRYFNYIFNTQGHYEKIYHRDLIETVRYCKKNKGYTF